MSCSRPPPVVNVTSLKLAKTIARAILAWVHGSEFGKLNCLDDFGVHQEKMQLGVEVSPPANVYKTYSEINCK